MMSTVTKKGVGGGGVSLKMNKLKKKKFLFSNLADRNISSDTELFLFGF